MVSSYSIIDEDVQIERTSEGVIKMKKSKTYIEAAKRIANNDENFCCNAIDEITGFDVTHLIYFEKYFRPTFAKFGDQWFGSCFSGKNQNVRVIALCFAAAIAESEGL